MSHSIVIRGARQNNLKNLDLELPTNELIVVTGVSGSGKSSLVFDTIYAEGQRRYVETFSPYARQFLDRMDRPQVERIEGIPPAIAIDQTNPVRTSRSTVGTMTELNDHLKLLFSRAAHLYCRDCGAPVRRDSAQSIYSELDERLTAGVPARDCRLVVTFPVPVPHNFSEAEVLGLLEKQGYTRVFARSEPKNGSTTETSARKGKRAAARAPANGNGGVVLEMIQDRVRFASADRDRVIEALESALRIGRGRVAIHVLDDAERAARVWRFSSDLHCAECDIHYREPTPSLFSFNSPLGACDSCRGFGRIIGIDFGLIVPDESKSLRGGAVRPWQTESYRECQDDLVRCGAS
jgi:excinuclease ABC subunit A